MRPTCRRTRLLLLAPLAAAALATSLGVRAATGADPGTGAEPPRPEPAGSECRTSVEGSRVVAYCHNPYPSVDLVRLHTECDRWWDVDADGEAIAVEPGRTVRLEDRCWKEVATAWVSHRPAPP
ncbi:hypothetical protein [Streptomyces sp. V2I9]|uniref:hypothetical protein n=1 Tax=Streptomyces sp. V2I9 TaxID=3042304 RepID=UPI0027866F0A|nr:hypothetical protein [Streptomyces sp. V2I9]MDQ0983730.1 hypothetical protein [Streptomyces sp. V2I9]